MGLRRARPQKLALRLWAHDARLRRREKWRCQVRRHAQVLVLMLLVTAGGATNLRADASNNVQSAGLSGDWVVWTGWYWPFNATQPPNLYSDGDALSRYDEVADSNSQAWEYDNHGPSLNEPDWAGHCHAWAGASVWE